MRKYRERGRHLDVKIGEQREDSGYLRGAAGEEACKKMEKEKSGKVRMIWAFGKKQGVGKISKKDRSFVVYVLCRHGRQRSPLGTIRESRKGGGLKGALTILSLQCFISSKRIKEY